MAKFMTKEEWNKKRQAVQDELDAKNTDVVEKPKDKKKQYARTNCNRTSILS